MHDSQIQRTMQRIQLQSQGVSKDGQRNSEYVKA
jgi:hypothetical protein